MVSKALKKTSGTDFGVMSAEFDLFLLAFMFLYVILVILCVILVFLF